MVSLYDVEGGQVRARMPGSSDRNTGSTYVTSLTADEITTFTDGQDGRVYSLVLDRWPAYACVVASRDLTRDEWSTYLPDRSYRRTCGDRA